MIKRTFCVAFAVAGLLANGQDLPSEKLPVRRVVLYKNGVGYFEHTGQVHGSQDLKVDFTSAQLNDVLKSLTVLDLNGGKIAGVGYNSVAPIAEQLKSLRLPLGESTTLAGFLNALRGSRIEIRSGVVATQGRLLSVEEKTTHKGPEETGKILEASLVTAGGEVRIFPISATIHIRIADSDLSEEIAKYLSLVGSERGQDLRQMNIATSGTGERKIFVSYISEVPVWKSTYRILLPTKADARPLLEGWAIVDNTVGEDWKDVQLSLVAGAPQSFIQEVSRPYYTRRPVIELPAAAMLTPQTHEGTMGEEKEAEAHGQPPPVSTPSATLGVVGGVPGGLPGEPGVGGGVFNLPSSGFAAKPAPFAGTMDEISTAAENLAPAASGQELGDLFQYNLKERVTILKNHSALVPIINARIKAEKVTLWSKSEGHPLRALWITNSSGLTLDGGTFNVIEDDVFAGEGLIDPLKPEERRLLSYAIDQAVRVESKDEVEARPVTHIKIAKGVMQQTSERRAHQRYVVRNTDTQPREVVIEHPVQQGWKLVDGVKPEETSASFYRFRVKVEPNKTTELKVDEVQPIERRIALSNITDDQIQVWLNDKTIQPELEQVLARITKKKSQIAGLDDQIKTKQIVLSNINLDQQRLRENMKALKGSAEEKALLKRYTRELNDQEDRLQATSKEVDELSVKRAEAAKELNDMLQALTLDQAI